LEFTFSFLVSVKVRGLRNGSWARLTSLDRGLFNCALALAKLRGRIRSMDLMVKLAGLVLRIEATVKSRLRRLGLAKALALKRLYDAKSVFNWAPRLREWLNEPGYILYLGLREVFG
jgi:hypothetical protein